MQGSGKAPAAAYGWNMQGSSAKYARNTSLSKTSGGCSPWVSTSSSAIWPRSGMMRNGKYYPLPPLVPRTTAKGCSLLPTPHCGDAGPAPRLLFPLQGIVGKYKQLVGISGWLGIRFDRTRKASAREAYRGPVLYRVDDGDAGRVDYPVNVPPVPRRVLPEWTSRLKALGNAILPQQSYAVGACIMAREGIHVPPMPV